MLLLLPLLLALAPPAPGGVAAAAAGPQELMRRMSIVAGARDYAGWTRDGDYDVTTIGDGLFGGMDVELEAGAAYSVAAVCGDCESIELEMFDPDGNLAARGRGFGESWLVELEPAQSGTYRLTVHPAGCAIDPCIIAYAHFTRAGD